MKQDRFTICFKTCGKGPLIWRGREWVQNELLQFGTQLNRSWHQWPMFWLHKLSSIKWLCSNDATTYFSFSSSLLFFSHSYWSDWRDEWECSLFLLLWLLQRDFCRFELKKIFWRWRDLNPQLINLIHDELDHRTTVSCHDVNLLQFVWLGFCFYLWSYVPCPRPWI